MVIKSKENICSKAEGNYSHARDEGNKLSQNLPVNSELLAAVKSFKINRAHKSPETNAQLAVKSDKRDFAHTPDGGTELTLP